MENLLDIGAITKEVDKLLLASDIACVRVRDVVKQVDKNIDLNYEQQREIRGDLDKINGAIQDLLYRLEELQEEQEQYMNDLSEAEDETVA